MKDNRVRHAMEFEDIIRKIFSHYGCDQWLLEGT
jgi:hypothetical protein